MGVFWVLPAILEMVDRGVTVVDSEEREWVSRCIMHAGGTPDILKEKAVRFTSSDLFESLPGN